MSGEGQLGFADAFLAAGLGSNRKLERLAGLIDWSAVEQLVAELRPAAVTGRPAYAPLAMVKATYLQALYDLSDPGLEEALSDRLSFRRFCGLALDATTPDETTICRFRATAGPLLAAALEEINRQLAAKGLMVRKGSLLDSTLIAANGKPPARTVGLGAGHDKEPDADWTRKNGKAFFGYKAHLGVDQGSGLVRRVRLTSAKTYESEVADALICGDEGAVYGDRAYEHKQRRARLKAAGIKDRIMHRRHKHLPVLPRWQQRRNHLIARRRAPVEAVFSAFKRLYGLRRARYRSLARNTNRLLAIVAVYNLRRAATISGP